MTLQIHASDPSAALAEAFQRIQRERMVGVALLHDGLRVQPVDFGRWNGQWLGALVTPWFLNLVLLPGDARTWRSLRVGERAFHRFGAGDFAFLGNEEPEVGEFQTCSLCSPVTHFPDQDTACATARMALRMLHVEQPAAALLGAAAPAPRCAAHSPPADHAVRGRRDLLFGVCRIGPS